jgi:hypothetical protein
MTSLRLNWLTQISVLAVVVACGSSKNDGVGPSSSSSANVGGKVSSDPSTYVPAKIVFG